MLHKIRYVVKKILHKIRGYILYFTHIYGFWNKHQIIDSAVTHFSIQARFECSILHVLWVTHFILRLRILKKKCVTCLKPLVDWVYRVLGYAQQNKMRNRPKPLVNWVFWLLVTHLRIFPIYIYFHFYFYTISVIFATPN